jgi:hypothetical protein
MKIQRILTIGLAAAWLAFFPTSTRADVITDWNATAIQVIKAVNPNPLPASRALAMTHVAQFDAVNAVVRCYQPYAADLSAPGASPEAAAAQAAYRVLTNLYPSQLATLDAALDASLGAVFFEQPKADGIALGNAVAATILARRANDGSATPIPYTPGSGPGVWIPTPPAFAPALLPHWRNVTPFTLSSAAQLRPGPPPALDSALYTMDFNEIRTLGDTNSAMRTPEQTATALFHIEFVPYTLGSAARYAVDVHPLPLVESARLFALLNLAMADSFISVWDAKFQYNFWRPVTAIRAADTDGNPVTDVDPAWTPLRATPPHPEYPAAHTIAAGAGAEVLASVFGDDFFFTIESPTLPGQPRTFARFSDFPVESGNARVWAGFHWRNSCEVGAQMGADIGRQAVAKYLRSTKPPTFTKITEGEIVNDGGSSAGVAWGDFNNDGFEDLFVANSNGENDFLYRNNGDGTFTRVTSGSIVTSGGASIGCAWGDFDNDGSLDLVVANGGGFSAVNNFLFRNNGNGTFTRTNAGPVGTDAVAALCSAWADYDRDGWLDLFVGDFIGSNNLLYRNTGDGRFTRVAGTAFVERQSLASVWGDYDNDSFPDLFVTRGLVEVNRLYRNNRDGTFSVVPSSSPGFNNSVSAAWGDYNNDGTLDLFVGAGGTLIQTSSALYRGDGDGGFEATGIVTDAAYGTSCAWGDYDNDGFLDLFQCRQRGQNNLLYHNNGDGTFTRVTEGSIVNDGGNSPGCAWADYDNDGFLDLIVSNGAFVGGSQNNFLYRNDGNGNRWLKIRLVGGPSNRAAIGAKVRVTATMGGVQGRQMREISGGSGFASQNSLIAHFGLAGATHADLVRIEWPSGTVQELRNVGVNQILTIIEPPRLTATKVSGQPQFSLRGGRHLQYDIEASTNLHDWSPMATVTITNIDGSAPITDPAPAAGQRFYRAVAR